MKLLNVKPINYTEKDFERFKKYLFYRKDESELIINSVSIEYIINIYENI